MVGVKLGISGARSDLFAGAIAQQFQDERFKRQKARLPQFYFCF